MTESARSYAVIDFKVSPPTSSTLEPSLYVSDQGEVCGALTVSSNVC